MGDATEKEEKYPEGYALSLSERLRMAHEKVGVELENYDRYLQEKTGLTPLALSAYQQFAQQFNRIKKIGNKPLSERTSEDNEEIDKYNETLKALISETGLKIKDRLPVYMIQKLESTLDISRRERTAISSSIDLPPYIRDQAGIEILAMYLPSQFEPTNLYRLAGTRPSSRRLSRFLSAEGFKLDRVEQKDVLKNLQIRVHLFTKLDDKEVFSATPLVYQKEMLPPRIFFFTGPKRSVVSFQEAYFSVYVDAKLLGDLSPWEYILTQNFSFEYEGELMEKIRDLFMEGKTKNSATLLEHRSPIQHEK